ncbi:MAG: hypothetical protein R3279_02420 [Putridiphycobacter sp.]|nr:hypothetical protein [Putridiphycobacter sp.]
MNNILWTILMTLLVMACADHNVKEQTLEVSICDCKELQHDPAYNVLHLGDRLKPFTGKCYDYYRGGVLKKDFTLKEGKYEGTLLYYHPNGNLQSQATYQEGLLFGEKKVFDANGQLLFHGIYKRSRLVETVYNINSK